MINILIADNSKITRTLLCHILLKNPDFKVVAQASNGKEAVHLSKTYNPDIILMDVNLPEISGLDATKIIMKENPTPILIFTSEEAVRIGYSAIESGAIDIIAKPDMEQMNANFASLLIQKIEKIVNSNKNSDK